MTHVGAVRDTVVAGRRPVITPRIARLHRAAAQALNDAFQPDRILLVVLALTGILAVGAMGLVLATGRRPRRRLV